REGLEKCNLTSNLSSPGLRSMQRVEAAGTQGPVCCVKLAATDLLVLSVTLQAPVPEQAPDQPAKNHPDAGNAFNVTPAPDAYCAEQAPGQLIWPSADSTAPLPEVVT